MPLVSVIVPAFRAESTLARAIDSLRAQSLTDWEVLIVSDDGRDYRALLDPDPRLVFLSTGKVGGGAPAARNVGLAAARGVLVAPLDADDLYYPERLARLTPLALEAGAAFDEVRVVEETSGRTLSHLFGRPADFRLGAAAFLRTSVPLMAVARRAGLAPWDPEIELCDDVAFNLRLFDRLGSLPVVAEALREYRVRPGSICHGEDSAARAERGYERLLARLETDGYGLADPALVAEARRAIAAKRALNRAYAEDRAAGRVADFQDFVAKGFAARGSAPPATQE